MISPESDSQTELLRSIAASLKGIQASLDSLTGAVEGVAESIEKAHEPEGDLGVHLVGALKDISSALHKKAQMERSPQHRQNHPHQQHRRDDRPPLRLELRPPQKRPTHDGLQQYPKLEHQEPLPSHTPHGESEHEENHSDALDAQRDYDNAEASSFETQNGNSESLNTDSETLSENTTAPQGKPVGTRKPRSNRRRGNRAAKPVAQVSSPSSSLPGE